MKRKLISLLLIFVLPLSFTSCKNNINTDIKESEDAVCRINLFASNGSYDKRFLMMNFGHSFISVESLSDSSLKVGDYLLSPGEEITLSIWPISGYRGVWYNIESEMIAKTNKYSDRVSVSFLIDLETLDEISLFLNSCNSWSTFYNCSSFTLDIYNIVTKSNYESIFVTPDKLVNLFKKYDFENGKSINENNNIGYFKEGEFEKCDLSY